MVSGEEGVRNGLPLSCAWAFTYMMDVCPGRFRISSRIYEAHVIVPVDNADRNPEEEWI
jgi:hypothetical protein